MKCMLTWLAGCHRTSAGDMSLLLSPMRLASLQQLCRIAIRRLLTRDKIERLVCMPPPIRRYLQYDRNPVSACGWLSANVLWASWLIYAGNSCPHVNLRLWRYLFHFCDDWTAVNVMLMKCTIFSFYLTGYVPDILQLTPLLQYRVPMGRGNWESRNFIRSGKSPEKMFAGKLENLLENFQKNIWMF